MMSKDDQAALAMELDSPGKRLEIGLEDSHLRCDLTVRSAQ